MTSADTATNVGQLRCWLKAPTYELENAVAKGTRRRWCVFLEMGRQRQTPVCSRHQEALHRQSCRNEGRPWLQVRTKPEELFQNIFESPVASYSLGSTQEPGYDLPGLVRRLVIETAAELERIHFPAGVGASSGGWDGHVQTSARSVFVPEGLSVWELSVEKNSQAKAEDDYSKRVVAPDGVATSEVTYVQLICRPWTKAESFAATHNAEHRWKEVRAYNVDDIETWLENVPATTIWLAGQIGRPIDGIRSADEWWADWLASTTVPLDEAIVLAGRNAQADALIARVSQPGTTVIGGDLRPEELRAFVAAAFARGTSDGGPRPVLFLSDTDDTRKLIGRPGNIVVVAPSMEFIRDLPASNHHVIVLSPSTGHADITVPPLSSSDVASSLTAAGVPDHVAHDHGALGRRSLLALRRPLAVKPSLHQPGKHHPVPTSFADEFC